MALLLALFILVPAIELVLLIELGQRIGSLETVALIVVTGIVGATLARQQGLRVIGTLQREMESGELPAASLLDGALILVASALLVTPGVLTDAVGFLCLVPAFRTWLRGHLRRRLERAVAEQRIVVQTVEFGAPGSGPEIDVTERSRREPPPGPGDVARDGGSPQ